MFSRTSEPSLENEGLTEPQRRHLRVFLQQVEEALDEMETLAVAPTSASKLFRLDVNDLPDGFAAAVRPDVLRVRGHLKALVEELGLESHPRSRTRHVEALLITTLVQVEDSGSKGLRGYGSLGPQVFSVVDPALAQIHQGLERIIARLGPAPDPPAGASVEHRG